MKHPGSAKWCHSRGLQLATPFHGFACLCGVPTPDLAAKGGVVIDDANPRTTLSRADGGRYASRASTHDENVELLLQALTPPFSRPYPFRRKPGRLGDAVFR
jgi:hypothetical protein